MREERKKLERTGLKTRAVKTRTLSAIDKVTSGGQHSSIAGLIHSKSKSDKPETCRAVLLQRCGVQTQSQPFWLPSAQPCSHLNIRGART